MLDLNFQTFLDLESKGRLPVVFDPGGKPVNNEATDIAVVETKDTLKRRRRSRERPETAGLNKTETSSDERDNTNDEKEIVDHEEEDTLNEKTEVLIPDEEDKSSLSLPAPLYLPFPPVWDPGGLCTQHSPASLTLSTASLTALMPLL